MKKTISILLAAVMLLCCVPLTVSAAGETKTYTESGNFEGDNLMQSGNENSPNTYVIPSGVTMTVPANKTVYLPTNAILRINQGGTLDVKGYLVLLGTAQLYCNGNINHSELIKHESDSSAAYVKFRFPALDDDLKTRLVVSFIYDGLMDAQEVPVTGQSYDIPLNTDVKITAHLIEPTANLPLKQRRDKYEDRLMKVFFNNVDPNNYQSGATESTGYVTVAATTAGNITYSKWTNDSDFLTTKRIILPSGEGYECVLREPDKVNKTEDGVIVLKYGQAFSFKVELDEAYDMSDVQVYIYNGYGWLRLKKAGVTNEETGESEGDTSDDAVNVITFDKIYAEPDPYGYYNIGAVTSDLTVTVTGVLKNSTITLIGNLLDTFRNIFNMLKEFFQSMQQLFSGG